MLDCCCAPPPLLCNTRAGVVRSDTGLAWDGVVGSVARLVSVVQAGVADIVARPVSVV